MSRLVLYQCTQAEVASSRSARVWTGPFGNGDPPQVHSVLYSPMVVSAEGAVQRVPDGADRAGQPGESASLWWIARPPIACPCRARSSAACRIAFSTNTVSLLSEQSHPAISLAKASMTNAV